MDRRLLDYTPESEAFEAGAIAQSESEWSGGTSAEEAVFGEVDEMELAARPARSDERGGARSISRRSDRSGRTCRRRCRAALRAGQALGGILKDAAKRTLPVVGRAIEQRLDGITGAGVGAQVVKAAGKYLGLELEGLSPEDQEFEAARSFVRFAGEAAKNARAHLRARRPRLPRRPHCSGPHVATRQGC